MRYNVQIIIYILFIYIHIYIYIIFNKMTIRFRFCSILRLEIINFLFIFPIKMSYLINLTFATFSLILVTLNLQFYHFCQRSAKDP